MMKRIVLPIAGALLACSVASHAAAQISIGGKVEAKAGVDVNANNSLKAKAEANKKAAAEAKARAEANAKRGAQVRARLNTPAIRPPTAKIEANVNANHAAKAGVNARKAMRAKANPNVHAQLNANANAAFKVPPPEVHMKLYGEGYANLSAEEQVRVRAERRAAHWAAFRAKHQAKITVERPKLLPPPFHAEFRVNASRIAKLQRIRFIAEGKKDVKAVAKADALLEKENKRHEAKLASLFDAKADAKFNANVNANAGGNANAAGNANSAGNANAKAKANANENSAVKKDHKHPEGT